MTDDLTTKQLKRYLKTGGKECPWCHNDDLIWTNLAWADEGSSGTVICSTCSALWVEIHKTISIDLVRAPKSLS